MDVKSIEGEVVYLICLDRPLSPNHTAKHYLGSTTELRRRIHEHKNTTIVDGSKKGEGSNFLGWANYRQIDWDVVRVWEGSLDEEYHLKSYKNSPALCPRCAKKLRETNEIKEIYRG